MKKKIDQCYSIDDKFVYFYEKPIPNSDAKTFKLANEITPNACYFAYDQNQLYAHDGTKEGLHIWNDVDTSSLEFFPSKAYFADRFRLYNYNSYFITYCNHENSSYVEFKLELQKRKPKADAWWNWDEKYFKSLKPINQNIFTDGEKIFFRFQNHIYTSHPLRFGSDFDIPYFSVIANADVSTFQSLNEYYSKDKNRVYHLIRPIESEVRSFEVVDKNFAKDKNGIWYNGFLCKEKIDQATMEIIDLKYGVSSFSFLKDKDSVYFTKSSVKIGKYKGYADQLVLLKNSDSKTFTIFDERWAKDKNNVYFFGKIWKQIDASTFEFLFTDKEFTARSYAKDKNHLYFANGMKIIKGIDGKSFKMFNEYWGADNKVVFSFKSDKIIKNLEAQTFKVLDNEGAAEDENYLIKYDSQVSGDKKLKMFKKR